MRLWEYLTTDDHDKFELNLMGNHGWELVAIYLGTLYWKREIQ